MQISLSEKQTSNETDHNKSMINSSNLNNILEYTTRKILEKIIVIIIAEFIFRFSFMVFMHQREDRVPRFFSFFNDAYAIFFITYAWFQTFFLMQTWFVPTIAFELR